MTICTEQALPREAKVPAIKTQTCAMVSTNAGSSLGGVIAMNDQQAVASHYSHGSLLGAIEDGLAKQGITPEDATIEDLGPVDEFHMGGRAATANLLDQLEILPSHKWLDVGCGLGGAARFAASQYGARIVGVDLTPEYVSAGRVLCDWVGLSERIELHTSSALGTPFAASEFDGAYMMHVGMNIEDKGALFDEVARVLKPGATFAIYDIMKSNSEELVYPVPWAASSETSWLAAPELYRAHLEERGFTVIKVSDRRSFAVAFFREMREANEARGGPPPLGLHVLMQQSTNEKIPNMVANMAAGRISPVEMIAAKA